VSLDFVVDFLHKLSCTKRKEKNKRKRDFPSIIKTRPFLDSKLYISFTTKSKPFLILQIISIFQKINHNFSDFSFKKRNAKKFSEKAKKKFAEKKAKNR